MDPDAALREIRAAIQRFHVAVFENDHEEDQLGEATQVIELFEGLDQWLTRKGFLPRAWQGKTDPPRHLPRDDDYTAEAVNRTTE